MTGLTTNGARCYRDSSRERSKALGHEEVDRQRRRGATPARESAQVEGCAQQSPLGRHAREATQQESPSRQLLLDDSEDRFDQLLSPLVRNPGFVSRHPDTMTAQRGVVRPYRHTTGRTFGTLYRLRRQGTPDRRLQRFGTDATGPHSSVGYEDTGALAPADT